MPDISMCAGEGCHVKDKCYRHVAKADEKLQSWSEFWRMAGADGCEWFEPVPARLTRTEVVNLFIEAYGGNDG